METHHQFQMMSLKDGEDNNNNHTIQRLNPLLLASSSSPSHEFSFNVAVERPSTLEIPEKNDSSSSSSALDLSPAGEIFSHGQLLPLHSFPRSSTDSPDHFFTLPIDTSTATASSTNDDSHHHLQDKNGGGATPPPPPPLTEQRQQGTSSSKAKPFSTLFSLPIRLKRRKPHHEEESSGDFCRKRKLKLDVIIKRYVKLVVNKPFLQVLLRRKKKSVDRSQHHRSTCSSFSGNLRTKGDKGFGDYSAPASMIHSPKAYSGVLAAASGSVTPTYNHCSNNLSASSSTVVEDLQEAIQAAIAHCKKSNDGGGSDGRRSTLHQPFVLSM